MYRATIVLSGMFIVTLAAGVLTGRLMNARATTPSSSLLPPARAGGSFLVNELQLSGEQSNRMRAIWEQARNTIQEYIRTAERTQLQQDEQLNALLTPAQRTEYSRITNAGRERLAALDVKRKEAFALAVAQTQEILRPDQWAAYQQILKNQVGTIPGADLATSTTRP
jgi:hypothetical protein